MSPAVPGRPARVLDGPASEPVAATGVSALTRGVLVIRWAVLAWMAVLVVDAAMARRTGGIAEAVTALGVAAAWVAWLTAATRRSAGGPRPDDRSLLVADLLVAGLLVVIGARQPWFATVYPVTAALAWAAARGARGGVVAGAALGLVSVAAGLAADGGGVGQVARIPLLRDPVNFVLAGGGLGFVADLLVRSAAQVREAQHEQVRATERAARATERESLGRQIHDSVLQSLALVHKRARELAERPQVSAAEVERLAEVVAAQERTVRAMILRPVDDDATDPTATTLRDRLEVAVAAVSAELDVSVSTVGDLPLPARHVREIGAAVDQALGNVVRHAGARHAWVFAEVEDDCVVVTVRDDGRGFTFDEDALRAARKFGLLHSILGRAGDLGGTVHIDSAPGRGAELELRIPVPHGDGHEEDGGG